LIEWRRKRMKRLFYVAISALFFLAVSPFALNSCEPRIVGTNAIAGTADRCFQAFLNPPATEWNQTYGGIDYDVAYSVIQTADGGYAIAGRTDSFGSSNGDFWLVKTDSTGNAQWNKTYAMGAPAVASCVIQTADGGYALAGYANYDFGLVKVDSSGNMEWNKTYGGVGADWAHSVIQTEDGGYALAGFYSSGYGTGGSDFWLVKVDSTGNMLWNKTYGGTEYDDAWSVVHTPDGGYALAGYTYSFGAGSSDFWLVKTDADGNMLWNKTYGGTDADYAYCMIQTRDGGYALAGETFSFGTDYVNFWLVKVDSSGSMQWNQTYGGTGGFGYEGARSLVQTSGGGYALAGFTDPYGSGYEDFWLVKTDSTGNVQWNETYGGGGHEQARSMVQTADGGYALAGYTTSFGAGSFDFWLVKVARPILVGDVDGNGKVNIIDVLMVAKAFGTDSHSPSWNPKLDVNSDSKVDIIDILATAKNFGQTDT
jgi:hypothetical protein